MRGGKSIRCCATKLESPAAPDTDGLQARLHVSSLILHIPPHKRDFAWYGFPRGQRFNTRMGGKADQCIGRPILIPNATATKCVQPDYFAAGGRNQYRCLAAMYRQPRV